MDNQLDIRNINPVSVHLEILTILKLFVHLLFTNL